MSPNLGACYQGESLLNAVPSSACKDLPCLWSQSSMENVDVWLDALKPLPTEAVSAQCPQPVGGQLPLSPGARPLLSFIVFMPGNARLTAQCVLELFRTASEVDSAEFIVVDDGAPDSVKVRLHVYS